MCNLTNINQQWNWLQEDKLLHLRTGQCLAITRSKVAHSRKVIVANCSEAPSWTCYSSEGLLEVKNSSLFLEKRSSRVVVKKGRKYPHSWKKLDVNEKGETIHENLCSKIGKQFEYVSCQLQALTDFESTIFIWLIGEKPFRSTLKVLQDSSTVNVLRIVIRNAFLIIYVYLLSFSMLSGSFSWPFLRMVNTKMHFPHINEQAKISNPLNTCSCQ